MKILVTGAKGFIGRNLLATLKYIDGAEVLPFDIDTEAGLLEQYAAQCDFVVHLAGINRPPEPSEFMKGNFGFTETLLAVLEKAGNKSPVLVTSSVQAALDNEYGKSKLAAEELLFDYADRAGARVHVYRLPNVFGKWCRPNYNSAVATFCHNIARNLPITVTDPAICLTLVYIDDVVAEIVRVIKETELTVQGIDVPTTLEYRRIKEIPVTHRATLGRITELLYKFKESRMTLQVPDVSDPFEKKLYSTYLSYIPDEEYVYDLNMHCDHRGSFTEIIRTPERGQFSVNISKPGITKGEHWHHTKNEKFLVVSGRGVIRLRNINGGDVKEFFVSGERLQVVDIPTGYTHNIENLGDTDMVTFMWANEVFNPDVPDTYAEKV